MHKEIIRLADDIEDKVIKYRRDFHKYPEVGWTEFRTASLIARRLIELGYEVKLGRDVINEDSRMEVPSKEELEGNYVRALKQGADAELAKFLKGGFTGVVGTLANGDGQTVALRFDIDALKIKETNDKNHFPQKEGFISVNENVMHACGHDGHIAIGLGTAEILSKIKDKINGTVKLIFQPAEEGVKGAKSMVDAGILDDAHYLLGGHIGLKANKSGEIICGTSGFLATSKIDATFIGKSSHAGAAPERAHDALLSAATAILNIHSIPRNSNGVTRVNVGKIISGTERNIVPGSAYMEIETRGETSELDDYMREYTKRILHGAAQMHDTDVKINYVGGAASAESDAEMINMVKTAAREIYDDDLICDEKVNFGASEDVSYMMNKVQSNGGKAVYMMFGSDLKAEHHNSKFDFNEKDLINSVKTYSMLVFDILNFKVGC